MKRSFILVFACFLFFSCSDSQENSENLKSVPRSEWDADNICYINTSEIDNSIRYKRLTGTSGIIGNFEYKRTEYWNYGTCTCTDGYIFYNTGYYLDYSSGYSTSGKPYNKKKNGKFVITKYTDDHYRLDLYSESGYLDNKFFYQVSDKGIYISSSYKDSDGKEHRLN
ncbi:hypothetical protein II906_01215 [bacterium]|nr:hypothetical protein [bacterium]